MAKLTKEQRIEMYGRYKSGESIRKLSLAYKINRSNVDYLMKLLNYHGIEILDNHSKTYYDPKWKKQIIEAVVIDGNSVYQTAGYVIVEKRKGRPSTMKKPTKKYENMTDAEKIKYLENKNLYLELENDYLKKLDAVIQKRKQQPPKK